MTISQREFKDFILQQEYKIIENLSKIAQLLNRTMSYKFGGVTYGYGQMIDISLSKNQEKFFVNYFFFSVSRKSNNLRKV